ncbi:nitrate- and nitrite sensing domain-containing protein [Streptomyces sp. NPDC049879]|uniref:nitrate- and nitrite sensing domain-containing protein n=1 Tax=Streptomyces sp. NPDC049879 TaxID=3365598 RepID=UPI0037BB9C21
MRLVLVAVIAISALAALVAVGARQDWERQEELRRDSATGELGGEASLPLFAGAQAERRMTAVHLANPTEESAAALAEQRALTDQGAASFRTLSAEELAEDLRTEWDSIETIYGRLDALPSVRERADSGDADPDEVTGWYTDLIADMVEFYQALSAMEDGPLAMETRPLVGLFWASEGLAQEDMIIAQARARGWMSAEEQVAFAAAYGNQRVMYERWIAPYLPATERGMYDAIVASDAWATLEGVEAGVINAPSADTDPAVLELPDSAAGWDAAYAEVAQGFGELNLTRTQGLLAHGYERADEVRNSVYLQVGGSAAAIVLLSVLIIWTIRSVIRGTARLRAQALDVAEDRLPAMVSALQRGEPVAADALPPAPATRDELGQVHRAIASLAAQAVAAAQTVATERAGFAQFTSGVAARVLALMIGRTLDLLDELQRLHDDNPALLNDLYELDHLTARTRRLMENLAVLAGGSLVDPHERPVHIANIVTDADGESAGFQRVRHELGAEAWVRPDVAGELTHLLAELIDNAAVYSPKDYPVTVRTVPVASGVVVEIEDRGRALSPEDIEELNSRLSRVPLYGELADQPEQLGLFVVGRLAHRLGANVTLRPSAYGGLSAVVYIPEAVLTGRPDDLDAPEPAPRARPAAPAPAPAPAPAAEQPRPQPKAPASAPAPVETLPSGLTKRTTPEAEPADAPALPQRRRGEHLAPQLRDTASMTALAPSTLAADDRTAEQIAAAYGGLDEAIRQYGDAPSTEHPDVPTRNGDL